MPTSRKNAPRAEDIDLGKTDEAAVEAAMMALGDILLEIASAKSSLAEKKKTPKNK